MFAPTADPSWSFRRSQTTLQPTSFSSTVKRTETVCVALRLLLCIDADPTVKSIIQAAVAIQIGGCSPMNSRLLYAKWPPIHSQPQPENLMSESKSDIAHYFCPTLALTTTLERFSCERTREPPRHIATCRAVNRQIGNHGMRRKPRSRHTEVDGEETAASIHRRAILQESSAADEQQGAAKPPRLAS